MRQIPGFQSDVSALKIDGACIRSCQRQNLFIKTPESTEKRMGLWLTFSVTTSRSWELWTLCLKRIAMFRKSKISCILDWIIAIKEDIAHIFVFYDFSRSFLCFIYTETDFKRASSTKIDLEKRATTVFLLP